MGDKELMWALKNGDLDEVKTLMKDEDVNRTLEGGRKPLHYAADCGQAEMLEFLLSKGADVNDEDVNRTLEGGRKPLHYAADCGQAEMLEFLLSKGADVNAPDKHGITPLLSATYEGHLSCVKILLEKVMPHRVRTRMHRAVFTLVSAIAVFEVLCD
ncbi:unnamed protein product, partial [Coregonus sp. 'balchen']